MARTDLRIGVAPELVFEFENIDSKLATCVSRYLDYFVTCTTAAQASSVVISDSPPPCLAPLGEPILVSENLSVSQAENVVFFEFAGIVAWCDPTQSRGGICLNGASPGEVEAFTHLALAPMLIELALAKGWIGIHAAAVSWGGKGILLPGQSGVGKSTTFDGARRYGFDVLSDDLVWLREGDRTVVVRPFPRGPGNRPTTNTDVELHAIVCPSIVDRTGHRLAPIPVDQTLKVLLAEGGFLSVGVERATRFRSLVRVARAVPGYLLEAGHDVGTVPARLARLADSLP